jgi:CRP-like cAMP-binding protein
MHRNRLLAELSRADLRRVLAAGHLEAMTLQQTLGTPWSPQTYVLFPLQGYVSLLADVGDGRSMEVGLVGREGVCGLGVVLGVPLVAARVMVQEAGVGWRIEANAMRRLIGESPALRRVLDRYIFMVLVQLSQASVCVRFHEVVPRLARWLLMCQDRSPIDSFPMTQQFLSDMLGVRRVSVTLAAGTLQRQRLIDYHRGEVRVLDRTGLLAVSCSCYQRDRDADLRVFGEPKVLSAPGA